MNTGSNRRVTLRGFGLLVTAAFICFSISGCGPSDKQLKEEAARKAKEETSETLLVCEGYSSSIVPGMSGKERVTFVITKVGGKVTKVKGELLTYTPERAKMSVNGINDSIYSQLIIESDKLVLRMENMTSKSTGETVLFNTGAYKNKLPLGSSEGQCTIAEKAF